MIKTPIMLCLLFTVSLFALLAAAPSAHAGYLGADVNADVDAFGNSQMDADSLLMFSQKNTVYALPMYNQPARSHARYWDNMVEQYQSAQIDFVAVWLKGNKQPETFANLVAALKRRRLGNRIKVMPFDDNPASWTALWNFDHGNGYGYKVPFDVGDPASRAYVWDKNLKVFFQSVPDANRYKIQGRPAYAIWSGAPAFLSHLNGNGSKLLNYLRQQCRSTFGFNPYIMVSADWVKNDPSSAAPGVVDAVYPWFTPVPGPAYSTWNVNTWNKTTLGTCISQFRISNDADPNASTWIVDPQHGETLVAGLAGTVGGGCISTFIEGFDDYWENTTLWRARNLDSNGNTLGYAQTYYEYPNQRINLVRRHSNNAFPFSLKVEAEGCDSFSKALPFPDRPNYYRNGSIAIEDTTDECGGYDVCNGQTGETLRWQDVPMEGTVRLMVRVATKAAGRMHFVIDGVTCPPVSIPNTGGGQTWVTVDAGKHVFGYNSYHAVSLVFDTPAISINWWQAQVTTVPDGFYRIVARQGGNVLSSRNTNGADGLTVETSPSAGLSGQEWYVHALGSGHYSLRMRNPDGSLGGTLAGVGGPPHGSKRVALSGPTGGASQQWFIVPQPDGFCSLRLAQASRTRADVPDVLDAGGGMGPAGTVVSLRHWGGYPNAPQQEWSLIPAS